jgi:hypothetical protein
MGHARHIKKQTAVINVNVEIPSWDKVRFGYRENGRFLRLRKRRRARRYNAHFPN